MSKRKPTIDIARVYDLPQPDTRFRVLVDRLWPRGVSKTDAQVEHWARSIAPSTELRRWYGHDPDKWKEFQRRYRAELDANPEGVAQLVAELGRGTNTLLYASKEERLNNATVLRAYLEERVGR